LTQAVAAVFYPSNDKTAHMQSRADHAGLTFSLHKESTTRLMAEKSATDDVGSSSLSRSKVQSVCVSMNSGFSEANSSRVSSCRSKHTSLQSPWSINNFLHAMHHDVDSGTLYSNAPDANLLLSYLPRHSVLPPAVAAQGEDG